MLLSGAAQGNVLRENQPASAAGDASSGTSEPTEIEDDTDADDEDDDPEDEADEDMLAARQVAPSKLLRGCDDSDNRVIDGSSVLQEDEKPRCGNCGCGH